MGFKTEVFAVKKYLNILIVLVFLCLVGCMGLSSKNDKVVLIVRGTEITLGEVRFMYGDDNIKDGITLMKYLELTKQEVEDLNLDITERREFNDQFIKELPPKDEANENDLENWAFAEAQAKNFKMDPQEYYLEYIERDMHYLTYFETYIHEFLDEPESRDEDVLEAYNVEVNELLHELEKKYESEIKILYK